MRTCKVLHISFPSWYSLLHQFQCEYQGPLININIIDVLQIHLIYQLGKLNIYSFPINKSNISSAVNHQSDTPLHMPSAKLQCVSSNSKVLPQGTSFSLMVKCSVIPLACGHKYSIGTLYILDKNHANMKRVIDWLLPLIIIYGLVFQYICY